MAYAEAEDVRGVLVRSDAAGEAHDDRVVRNAVEPRFTGAGTVTLERAVVDRSVVVDGSTVPRSGDRVEEQTQAVPDRRGGTCEEWSQHEPMMPARASRGEPTA
ncbi:hypothetical protein [Cellulomonas bogoriensis]|uniref:Uncharacterized protein n=1 Tax=Cellulomonas bogoriensis 69B4 = DSM 16987 TaxID=1386082 RepID=A0A0A0BY66_9CELL|nr:hypothetical protein [Cellulomonas bogoriensis]KGM12856.1 hypothetical protein N869_01510 [Cellulomonas bogoriensis 69B4 = DSM 16987]